MTPLDNWVRVAKSVIAAAFLATAVAPVATLAPVLAPAAAPTAAIAAATKTTDAPRTTRRSTAHHARSLSPRETAFLDTLERQTFRWFWHLSDAKTGLTPDRAPTPSFVSVGAMGFALTAYPIGAERGYVSRHQAAERVRRTLEFMWAAPQDSAVSGSTGYRGFFFHFLEPATGHRYEKVELSTMDTALLLAGVLFCQSYFDRRDPDEVRVRALAESLYARADWNWAQVRPPTIVHGWTPEDGFLPYDWRGYNESMLVPLLALGSTTHPVGPEAWGAWTAHCRWGTFYGYDYIGFAPLFGYQYSHLWIDFRGIQDDTMRTRGIDYFENSRRATLAQRAYAIANPGKFRGYGPQLWGLTACDGPVDSTVEIDGVKRTFRTYAARGASFTAITDDGTVSPAAAGGSIPFAPKETIGVLMSMRATYGDRVFSKYGFVDALNPTLNVDIPVHHGRVMAGVGWFDTDRLGIDQGPLLAMAENVRSGLIWRTMRRNPHLIRALKRAGFRGGWLDRARESP